MRADVQHCLSRLKVSELHGHQNACPVGCTDSHIHGFGIVLRCRSVQIRARFGALPRRRGRPPGRGEREAASRRTPREAAQQSLEHCSQSILTSGLTFFAATFGVAVISQIELMRSICLLISRGALISTVVILVVLPAALMLLDGLIRRTTLSWLPSAAPQMSEKE